MKSWVFWCQKANQPWKGDSRDALHADCRPSRARSLFERSFTQDFILGYRRSPLRGCNRRETDPMPQSFVCLHYHLIFSTIGREPILTESLQTRLYEYVGGILRAERSTLLAAGGMPDHTHWLVSLHQQIAVADALRTIKSSSSKWIREEYPELRRFAWQAGYGAFSVSYSNLEAVKNYINGQAEHHRTTTFQDEYRAFLKRHDAAFDERYLWD